MMKSIWVLAFSLILMYSAFSQYDPLRPPNTFDTDQNPLYWKNRKPNSNYWQQDVHYTIKATLDDQEDRIDGIMKLVYTNNSPDTLQKLVFHLYQNAFEPGSYASQFNDRKTKKTTGQNQHIEVSDITVNAMEVETELDNTILFLDLQSPIRPGEKAVIECRFSTFFRPINGRMKLYNAWGYKHFNVVHWYPRISVYDQKFGWTTDQHLGHEFYGDFGAFDVELTLPEHYILDGTGYLLNRNEVLPPSLMERIALDRFADKPWNEAPSEVIPRSERTKTWRFHAENVHDFAWTADPTYRISKTDVELENGQVVACYALAQEPHASGWQNAAQYTARVVEVYSKDFGPYAYHKMIVADARDGMEYPMLTLDAGKDPSYRGLLAHEVGHNWFFGMVGNNETYRASLDEGFTQFLTAWSLTELEGDTVNTGPSIFGVSKPFDEFRTQRDRSVYEGYYRSSTIKGVSPRLNTHSDQFEDRRQYGQVYSKTGTMLYNLQYTLGDELFIEAMQHYFDQWKFCHPYFEDFRASVIQFTEVDLNWFFDQWLESNGTIDYSLEKFRKKGPGLYELELKRKGMQMPLDIDLISKTGRRYSYHIPNNYFTKETDATVLSKWYGWGDLGDTYRTEIDVKDDIESVVIDPSGRLADVYQLDNRLPMKVSVELNDLMETRIEQSYELEWNPTIWYNGYDGLKTGLHVKGGYAKTFHQLDATIWFNTGVFQQPEFFEPSEEKLFNRINYSFTYSQPLRKVASDFSYTFHSAWLEGLFHNDYSFRKEFDNDKSTLVTGIAGLYRPSQSDLNYLLYADQWSADQWNNYSYARILHVYPYGRRSLGKINAELRSPFLASDYNYGFLNLDVTNDNQFAFFNWKTRVFGQFGFGNDWAPESQLFAAGGNPEQMMQNVISRSVGFIPSDFYGYSAQTGHFQYGGGLNLRGYNNYFLPELNGDSLLRLGFVGHSGLAFNTELEFDDVVKVLGRYRRFVELKTYVFGDAGVININRSSEPLEWSQIRIDAGLGACLEIKQWGKFTDLKPISVRFDVPLFLNRPPAGEEFFAFRWLIGFQRAF